MIIKIFLFWRIGLFLIGYLGSRALPKVANGGIGAISPSNQFDYWASWAQWDGGHYFEIASHGYTKLSDYAFFPLFPLLTKFMSPLFVNNIIFSGLAVSGTVLLLALFVIYNYAAKKYGSEIALNTITSFLVFPTAFFAVAIYSESLFLLLAATTFIFLDHKKYLPAAIAAALASLTRPVGIFLVISLFYSYFAHINFSLKRVDKNFLHLFVSLFGFSTYAIYLWSKLNDPFKFFSVQSIWERNISNPISTILYDVWVSMIRTRPFIDYLNLGSTLVFLIVLILGVRKISSSIWIFSVLVILIPVSSGTLASMPRYVLSSLGTFIIIGKFLEEKPWLKIPLWAMMLIAQSYLLVRFLNGYWVA